MKIRIIGCSGSGKTYYTQKAHRFRDVLFCFIFNFTITNQAS